MKYIPRHRDRWKRRQRIQQTLMWMGIIFSFTAIILTFI